MNDLNQLTRSNILNIENEAYKTENNQKVDFLKYYYNIVKYFREHYDPNIAIFIRHGEFYKNYDLIDNEGNHINNTDIISNILNIKYTRKYIKKAENIDNPSFIKIESEKMIETAKLLGRNNYNVVLSDIRPNIDNPSFNKLDSKEMIEVAKLCNNNNNVVLNNIGPNITCSRMFIIFCPETKKCYIH